MKSLTTKRGLRCAIYTRVSTDQGLEQDFNSLDAQREASEAYIKSQAHEGWRLVRDRYDDGGFSGGSMDRPADFLVVVILDLHDLVAGRKGPAEPLDFAFACGIQRSLQFDVERTYADARGAPAGRAMVISAGEQRR